MGNLPFLKDLKAQLGAQVVLSYSLQTDALHVEFIYADGTIPFLHYEFRDGHLAEVDDSVRL